MSGLPKVIRPEGGRAGGGQAQMAALEAGRALALPGVPSSERRVGSGGKPGAERGSENVPSLLRWHCLWVPWDLSCAPRQLLHSPDQSRRPVGSACPSPIMPRAAARLSAQSALPAGPFYLAGAGSALETMDHSRNLRAMGQPLNNSWQLWAC